MTAVMTVLRSVRLRAILALGMVLGLGTVGTLAAWSATTTTTSGTFVTGTVDITVNNAQGKPDPFVLTMPTGTLLPGGSTAVLVTVRNVGSLAIDYTTTSAITGALGNNVTVAGRAGVGTAVSGSTCAGPTTGVVGSTRHIARGAEDVLCMQFTLASTAPNTAQGQAGTATFTFTATGVPSA